MIQAVIFDMDGLMFETEKLFLDVFPGICQTFNVQVPQDIAKSLIGRDSSVVRELESVYPGITAALQEGYQKSRMDLFSQRYPLPGQGNKPGLQAIVTYLKQEGIPFGIATSSSLEDVKTLIGQAGFPIEPDAVVSSKQGLASKPDPAVFLEAARQLGQKPEDIVVLEDSKNGILAAKAGGFQSIWIPDQIERDEEMDKALQMEAKDLKEAAEIIAAQR